MKKVLAVVVLVIICVFFYGPFACAEQAPDFSLEDTRGDIVTLSNYNGEVSVVLFFWTTWCPYCLRELENLNDSYEDLIKEGIEILAINAGESKKAVERFARSRNFPFRILLDTDTQVSFQYGVMGIPTYIFIDESGDIIRRGRYLK